MMKYFFVSFVFSLGFSFAYAQTSISIQERDEIHSLCREAPTTIEKRTYGSYQIEIASAGDQSCQILEIKKSGKLVYERAEIGTHFYFGDTLSEQGRAFQRLTGKKAPNLVVSEWTGGMHCCYLLHIFELGADFKKVGELGGGNFGPELRDLDKDGVPEVVLRDDVLAEVFSCFADSATGRVIVQYSPNGYRVAANYMKRPPPG